MKRGEARGRTKESPRGLKVFLQNGAASFLNSVRRDSGETWMEKEKKLRRPVEIPAEHPRSTPPKSAGPRGEKTDAPKAPRGKKKKTTPKSKKKVRGNHGGPWRNFFSPSG